MLRSSYLSGLLVYCLVISSLVLFASRVQADDLQVRLNRVVSVKGAGRIAVSVFDLDKDAFVYDYGGSKALKPASVLKLLISQAAFELLGPDFSFETAFLSDRLVDGRVDNLYVLGGGDPDFTTEDMWISARAIKRRGIKSIGNVILDASLFETVMARQGQRAYQAGSSALPLNFNSVAFEVCPSSPGRAALVSVEPWEYPVALKGKIVTSKRSTSSFSIDEAASAQKSGRPLYIVRGAIPAKHSCQSYYRSVPDPIEYFGYVLKGHLQSLGVMVSGKMLKGAVPGTARELYIHRSKPLSQIVEDLNHYSNNFTAEQLLMALDQTKQRSRRRDAGLKKLAEYLDGLGFPDSEFKLEDASGLSHQNRISARILTRVLAESYKVEAYRPEFEKSLSVSGRNGTLKKRSLLPQNIILRAKTGTLDGVSSLAGYLTSLSGRRFAFAILQNGITSKAAAELREKRILNQLCCGK